MKQSCTHKTGVVVDIEVHVVEVLMEIIVTAIKYLRNARDKQANAVLTNFAHALIIISCRYKHDKLYPQHYYISIKNDHHESMWQYFKYFECMLNKHP